MTSLLRADYGATTLKKASVVVFGLGSAILVARYLGPELRADYAVILNWAAILAVVLNLGVNTSYQPARRLAGMSVIPLYVAYSLCLLVAVALIILVLGSFVSNMVVAIMILTNLMVVRLHLQTYHLIESLWGDAKTVIAAHFSYLIILSVICAIFPAELSLALVALFAKEAITALLSLRGLSRLYSIEGRGEKDINTFLPDLLSSFRKIRRVRLVGAAPYFLLSVLIVANYRIDVIFLDILGVDRALIGVFSVGVLIGEYLWIFADVFKDVQTSRTSKGARAQTVATASRIAIFITLAVYALFLATGYWFVILFFGSDFAASFHIACLMLVANIFMIPCKILGAYLISTKKISAYVTVMFVGVLLNTALNMALIPLYGVYGAIIASIVSYAVAGAVVVATFAKVTDVRASEAYLFGSEDIASFVKIVVRR